MRRIFIVVAMAVLTASVFAADQATYSERQDWLLEQDWDGLKTIDNNATNCVEDTSDTGGVPNCCTDLPLSYGSPKHGMPFALMDLYNADGADDDVRAYVACALLKWNSNNYFEPVGVVRAAYMFWDDFTDTEKDAMLIGAQQRQTWASPNGTPNHRLMFLTNGYLLAKRFPDETEGWHASSSQPDLSSADLMDELESELLDEAELRFEKGIWEYLSPNYLYHNIIPLLNLYEYEKGVNSDLVPMTQSLLAYHLTHLALNVHEGYVVPPYARSRALQFTGSADPTPSFEQNGTVMLNWLYWGHIDPDVDRLTVDATSGNFLVYIALSDFTPWPVLDRIANGRVNGSFVTRSSVPTYWFQEPYTNGLDADKVKRSVYRTEKFAMGAGVMKVVPDGHYFGHSDFGVGWSTSGTDKLRYLEAGHPYWTSDGHEWDPDDPDTGSDLPDWDTPGSPFMQMVHHENMALILATIPTPDPWPSNGRYVWQDYREENVTNLEKACRIRYPRSVQTTVNEQVPGEATRVRWFFIREDDVFIGIRTLYPATHYVIQDPPTDEQFRVIQSYGNCGFIIEVADADDYADFDDFKTELKGNTVDFDPNWSQTFEAKYTNADNVSIELEYVRSNDPQATVNKTNTWPIGKVDGSTIDYDNWPMISVVSSGTPAEDEVDVHMDGSILDVKHAGDHLKADLSGTSPSFSVLDSATYGDANQDGRVNGVDATTVQGWINSSNLPDPFSWDMGGLEADVDGNGLIETADVSLLQDFADGDVDNFPAGDSSPASCSGGVCVGSSCSSVDLQSCTVVAEVGFTCEDNFDVEHDCPAGERWNMLVNCDCGAPFCELFYFVCMEP